MYENITLQNANHNPNKIVSHSSKNSYYQKEQRWNWWQRYGEMKFYTQRVEMYIKMSHCENYYTTYFPHSWKIIPNTYNLNKKKFILPYNLKVSICGQQTWVQKWHVRGPEQRSSCSYQAIQAAGRGRMSWEEDNPSLTSPVTCLQPGPASQQHLQLQCTSGWIHV